MLLVVYAPRLSRESQDQGPWFDAVEHSIVVQGPLEHFEAVSFNGPMVVVVLTRRLTYFAI